MTTTPWLYLGAGVLVLLLILLCVHGYKKRKSVFLPNLSLGEIKQNQIARTISLFVLVALLLSAFSIALKDTFREEKVGVIAYVVDESRSFAAENKDGRGRIERARDVVLALDSFPYTHVALYGFTDGAFSHSSFSRNHSYFRDTVKYLAAIEAVPGSGSDLGSAILDTIEELHTKCRELNQGACLLVFISDGENLGTKKTLIGSLKSAQLNDIKIVSVGVGEQELVPIPMYDEQGKLLDYERDGRGARYLTRLDEDTMQFIARETGGIYVRENELEKARAFIEQNLAKENVEVGKFQSPLAAILLILAIVPFVVYTRLSKT